MIKTLFDHYKFGSSIFIYLVIVMFFFIFNPHGLSTDYGSGGGRFADRVDSFSEYIIRNTITRNIVTKGNTSFLPIMTKGYTNSDYTYYPDKPLKYYTNICFQTIPATVFAEIFRINTEKKLYTYFSVFRFMNALLLSILLIGIFTCFCHTQKLKTASLIPLVVGSSSGFIYFCQNMYFLSFLIILPAFFIAVQLTTQGKYSKLLVFIFGLLYFFRGYEFATVFALFSAFIAALFVPGKISKKIKSASLAFGLICLSFVLTTIVHGLIVLADSHWQLSLSESYRLAFGSLQYRTASINGVPPPFSNQFYTTMNTRLNCSAFSVMAKGFKLSELSVILLMLAGTIIRTGKMSHNELLIYLYGFFGYASWYIFAYQHIMWHDMYDWHIFALTTGLSFSLLLLFYSSIAFNYFLTLYLKFQNKPIQM